MFSAVYVSPNLAYEDGLGVRIYDYKSAGCTKVECLDNRGHPVHKYRKNN